MYKQCWAADGTTHWGYFEDESVDDLQEAGWLWSQKILSKSGIDENSRVLEIGCGNGAVSVWLAEQAGCPVVGIDLSSVRIDNARKMAEQHPDARVTFFCGSITDMPFEDGQFTHVWGQGVLYHVPDLDRAFAEVARVLAPRGVVLIDDFVGPQAPVSEAVHEHFYDRLKFKAKYSHEEYIDALKGLSLMPVETIDMGKHIERTYALVTRAAETIDEDTAEIFRVCGRGVASREIVGYFYKCVKVLDPRKWAYESETSTDIAIRYDAWAHSYDGSMEGQYDSPERAAEQLARHVTDKSTQILDVGCGTGLVGQALASAGYTQLHGLDMSREMLKVAEQKQCYSRLFQFDLVADADVEPYPAIVAVGCVTYGHAPGYTLARLYSWLTPGGVLHITVRRDFMADDRFFKPLLDGLRWDLLEEESWTIAGDTQHMAGLLLKKHPSAT
ncbi:MAG: methyltransferase domain-containing protein [Myxococcota bacterium]